MNVEIKGIHVEVNERIRNYIDTKMPRLDFGKDLLVDFLLNISREKSLFKLDTTLNFRWGAVKHVAASPALHCVTTGSNRQDSGSLMRPSFTPSCASHASSAAR